MPTASVRGSGLGRGGRRARKSRRTGRGTTVSSGRPITIDATTPPTCPSLLANVSKGHGNGVPHGGKVGRPRLEACLGRFARTRGRGPQVLSRPFRLLVSPATGRKDGRRSEEKAGASRVCPCPTLDESPVSLIGEGLSSVTTGNPTI